MSIHHAIQQKAEKLGLIITETAAQFPDFKEHNVWPDNTVAVHWPQPNLWAFGIGAKPAMAEAEALMEIKRNLPDDAVLTNLPRDPFMVLVFSNKSRKLVFIRGGATPQDTLAEMDTRSTGDGEMTWLTTVPPEDGAEAFRQGFMAADNPFEEDSEEAEEWDAAFDEAADAEAAEQDEDAGGSVVASKFRQRYAEQGHPNHCGDWLAEIFNNIVGDSKHLNVEALDELAVLNNVDNTKYNRTNPGWQGRLRMTTRNLIAPKAFKDGVIHVPKHVNKTGVLRAPKEWIDAQPYKRPAK